MSLVSLAKVSKSTRHSRGFTLIEIMVTLVLVAILLAGLVELFVSTKRNSVATSELSRLQETGRNAIQILAADVRRAGYLGGHVQPENIAGSLGPTDPNTPNTVACTDSTTDWGRKISQPVVGLNDTNIGHACILNSEYKHGDVLTLRFASSWPIATGDMAAAGLYFRTDVMEGKIFAGAAAGSAANLMPGTGVDNLALMAHSYYVGDTLRSCRGELIPALFRKSLDTAGLPVSQELLAGVEHLQFRYREGTRYRDADSVVDWTNVSAVEISVLVRGECPESGFINTRDFAIGDLSPDYGPDDAFRRQLFTTVATIRSRG